MSYVIQNFSRMTSLNRLSYRRYYTWLYRNTASIWLLMNYLNTASQLYLQWEYPSYLLKAFFSRSLTRFFTREGIKWRPVRESQWVKGLDYWTSYLLIATMDRVALHSPTHISPTSQLFFNQVLLEKRYLMIAFSQKYYRYALVTFLHLLIRPWQYWRHQLSYSLELVVLTHEFFLLRFLNTRLFKVYLV